MLMMHTEYTLKQRNIKTRLNNHKLLDDNLLSKTKLEELKEFYVDNQLKKTFRYFETNFDTF